MSWYLVITSEMREAGLTGNRLLVYACIAGYSRDGQGAFFGTLDYISDVCGVSRRTAISTLQELESEGFILSKKRAGTPTLYAVTDKAGGCKNCTGAKSARVQKLHGGGAKIAPPTTLDNKIINKYNNIFNNNAHAEKNQSSLTQQVSENRQTPTNDKKGARVFTPPTPSMVAEYAQEAGLTIDAAAFCDYYTANGWKVGRNAMKDWRAAVRSWAHRDKQASTPTTPLAAKRRPESSYAKMQELLNQTNAELAEWTEGRQ